LNFQIRANILAHVSSRSPSSETPSRLQHEPAATATSNGN